MSPLNEINFYPLNLQQLNFQEAAKNQVAPKVDTELESSSNQRNSFARKDFYDSRCKLT